MKKFREEKNIFKNQKREYLLKIVFLIVFLLLGTQIIISNTVSSSGDRLQLLDQKHQQLQSQNEILSLQISYLTSLTTLENRAKLLGYMKGGPVIYLQKTINVAMKEVK